MPLQPEKKTLSSSRVTSTTNAEPEMSHTDSLCASKPSRIVVPIVQSLRPLRFQVSLLPPFTPCLHCLLSLEGTMNETLSSNPHSSLNAASTVRGNFPKHPPTALTPSASGRRSMPVSGSSSSCSFSHRTIVPLTKIPPSPRLSPPAV
jgi:hypothetical protein